MFDRCQPALRYLTVAVAAALLLTAPVQAQDSHGAVAFSRDAQGQAVAYGFAWNYAAGDEARAAAMNACVGRGGKNCVELASFQNGCGALALDQHGMAQGKSGMSREQAEARALRTCEAAGGSGCAVAGSQCASPGEQPGTWSGSESVLAAAERSTAARPAKTGAARDAALTREERIGVQRGLASLGFGAGLADGMFGPRTRSAIREWQQAKGLEATGYVTRDEAQGLAAAGAAVPKKSVIESRGAEIPEANSKGRESGTAGASSSGENNCSYAKTPGVWEFSYPRGSHNKVTMCLGVVNCHIEGKYYKNLAVMCYLENGECPGGHDCAKYDRNFITRLSKTRVVPEH